MHILTVTSCDKVRPPIVHYIDNGFINLGIAVFNLGKAIHNVYGTLISKQDEKNPDAVYYGKIVDGVYVPYLNIALEDAPKEKDTSNQLAAA